MADERLVAILGDPRVQVAFDLLDDLRTPVGTEAYELPLRPLASPTLRLFDQVAKLDASITPRVVVLGDGRAVDDLYGDSSSLSAPAEHSLAELELDAAVDLEAVLTAPAGQVTISAQVASGARLRYRHVTAVDRSESRLQAILDLAGSSRLPHLIRLAAVPEATAHRLEALFYLDFGLEAKVGKDFVLGLQRAVFDGLPAELTVKGTASAQAAVGLGLYERMVVVVGRGDRSSTPGWVRLRLERESRRRFSFSVLVEVQAKYDLGSSLAPIVAKAFDQVPPLPRAAAAFEEINRLVADGDWEDVKERLSEELGDTLSEWLDGTGWKTWAADEAQELLATARTLVEAYRGLGPRLQSWWDHLLGVADLGNGSQVRRLLQRLAALGAGSVDLSALIAGRNGDVGELLDLVEALSGESIEEILLRPEAEARSALTAVAAQAQKLLDFLNEGATEGLLAEVESFARRTGIAGTVDFLERNATSLDQVDGFISERVKALAGRWVGKAFDELTVTDRERVEEVAQRISRVLGAPAALEAKLQAAVAKLEGDIGFSLALEVDRVSQHQALVDMEVDPDPNHDDLHREIEAALAGGSVAGILQALDGALREVDERDDPNQPVPRLPFLLRQCVFQSRRVRTSAVSTMLRITVLGRSFEHNARTVSQRLEERELEIEQVGEDLRRRATYAGAYTRTEILNKLTDRTGYTLRLEDAGAGGDPGGQFDDEAGPSVAFDVSFLHEDRAVHTQEIRGLDRLLGDLGFVAEDSAFADLPLTDQSWLRLAVDLRFPRTAVEAFLAGLGLAAWNDHFLAAGRRWFAETTVWVPDHQVGKVSLGEVMRAVTSSELFTRTWGNPNLFGRDFVADLPVLGLDVSIRGNLRRVALGRPAGGGMQIRQPYLGLKTLLDRRRRGHQLQTNLANSLRAATGGRTDAAYRAAAADAARAWDATVVANNNWPSTLFGLWLLLRRLHDRAPQTLEAVTGVARLSWREPSDTEWSGPRGWRIEGVRSPVPPVP
jgi:hypothetical protein